MATPRGFSRWDFSLYLVVGCRSQLNSLLPTRLTSPASLHRLLFSRHSLVINHSPLSYSFSLSLCRSLLLWASNGGSMAARPRPNIAHLRAGRKPSWQTSACPTTSLLTCLVAYLLTCLLHTCRQICELNAWMWPTRERFVRRLESGDTKVTWRMITGKKFFQRVDDRSSFPLPHRCGEWSIRFRRLEELMIAIIKQDQFVIRNVMKSRFFLFY